MKLTPEEEADIATIKAMRERIVTAISLNGDARIVKARHALIAMAEVVVPLALMLSNGNRALARDLVGDILDQTLDAFTTTEMEAKRKELSAKYGGVMSYEEAVRKTGEVQ